MTRSTFLVAWILGHVILITGIISLFFGIMLWIGAERGLTIFAEIRIYSPNPDAQTRQMVIDNILISLMIIVWGVAILYLRRRKHPNSTDDIGLRYELFSQKSNTVLGNIGGLITIIGLGWLLFIFLPIIPLPSLASLIIAIGLFPIFIGQMVVLLPNQPAKRRESEND